MLASLNLLALLTSSIMGLALGDRAIRAISAIIMTGVLATIFVQRITDAFAPGVFMLVVDATMLLAFFVVCVSTRRRWCWAVLAIQILIVLATIARSLGFSQFVYMDAVGALSNLHAVLVLYALWDRYFGGPVLAPPPPGSDERN
jgi:hypothetical protein